MKTTGYDGSAFNGGTYTPEQIADAKLVCVALFCILVIYALDFIWRS